MAEEAQSPSKVSNDDLVEQSLILVQQLFAEQRINDQERDHLKGKQTSMSGVIILLPPFSQLA